MMFVKTKPIVGLRLAKRKVEQNRLFSYKIDQKSYKSGDFVQLFLGNIRDSCTFGRIADD